MVADPACDVWKCIGGIDKAESFCQSSLSCKSHIFRNWLVNRTSFHTRCYIAVKEGKWSSNLRGIGASELLAGNALWRRDSLNELSQS